ncbi:hypothetical protein EVAR_43892_1 [Eumeta japonica]|uniref:Uncharacterized protein n=1 Tax=Eumeta variegata TaxID=151549 RepID=A0A4C1WN40_EUMVA|nr:hypothetical protein EVAR_43892_1 [Eumeta japonica]
MRGGYSQLLIMKRHLEPLCRWFKEFRDGRNSLEDEEHTGKPVLRVAPDNAGRGRKMIKDDNRCTYDTIKNSLVIGSAGVYKDLE